MLEVEYSARSTRSFSVLVDIIFSWEKRCKKQIRIYRMINDMKKLEQVNDIIESMGSREPQLNRIEREVLDTKT